jgi:enterochelin esterase-like enzyme
VSVAILSPDASRHGGRLLGPLEAGKVPFTFAADEGQGRYSIVVANPGAQPLAYEVLIDRVVSLDERLRPEPWRGTLPSPRIQILRNEIASGQSTETFWKEMADRGTPLVEPLGSDGKYHLVTFLWRARHETRNVVVLGSFLDPVSIENLAMHRLGTSDVWHLTAKMPAGARFTYSLSPNDPMVWDGARAEPRAGTSQMDPLNPHRMLRAGRSCGAAASKYACINVAELPDAAPQPWTISKPATPKGRVERRSIDSKIQQITRQFSVYTPANYKADGRANSLLILFDGPFYVSNDSSGWYDQQSMQTLTTLNELVAAATIRPTVVLFVNNVGNRRLVDLLANLDFADVVSTELVPWVRANYNVTTNPSLTAVGGYSAGGFAAAYTALRHPEVFGNVISQSGSFWWAPDHNGGYCGGICRDSGYVAEENTRRGDGTALVGETVSHEPQASSPFRPRAGRVRVGSLRQGRRHPRADACVPRRASRKGIRRALPVVRWRARRIELAWLASLTRSSTCSDLTRATHERLMIVLSYTSTIDGRRR